MPGDVTGLCLPEFGQQAAAHDTDLDLVLCRMRLQRDRARRRRREQQAGCEQHEISSDPVYAWQSVLDH